MRLGGGVATGFVREVDAEHGRVKVEFRAVDEQLLSPWAPIAAAMSGGNRGALFMPEQGDEVLIAFEHGNFEHPYVVGFLWNGEHRSPETAADNRVIVTPGGHQLRFEDGEAHPRVVLKSAGNRSLTLDDEPKKPLVEIKSGSHTITLDDDPVAPKLTLQAGTGLGVTITMNTRPTPSLSIAVGTQTIDVGATGMTITSTGVVSLNCTGVTNLTTPVLNVNAGVSTFSGVVVASTLVTTGVVSPLYTPGLGNLI